jgi:predicted AAA+ superfamily ATPase
LTCLRRCEPAARQTLAPVGAGLARDSVPRSTSKAKSSRARPAPTNTCNIEVELQYCVKDAAQFEKFIKLLAGRVGQLMDHTSLAGDVGVSNNTIKHWLSILEASFVVYKLPPYFDNFGKRVIRSPKYYFTDTGLLSFLLGIENAAQVARAPLLGHLFENMVVMDFAKNLYNQGKLANLYFYRDSNGLEVDLLFQQGRNLIPMEIKSSSTYKPELLKGLKRICGLSPLIKKAYLIYAGDPFTFSDGITAVRFDNLSAISKPD